MKIHLVSQSAAIDYAQYKVLNTYTKEGIFCVMFEDRGVKRVHKYPLVNIFRIEENYNVQS